MLPQTIKIFRFSQLWFYELAIQAVLLPVFPVWSYSSTGSFQARGSMMVSTHLLGSNAFFFLRLLFISTLPRIPWYAILGCFTAWWCQEFQVREDENKKASSDPGSRIHTMSSSPLSIPWSKSQDQPILKRIEKSTPSPVVGIAMSHWHGETWFIEGHYPNDLPQEIILELSVTQEEKMTWGRSLQVEEIKFS